MPQLFVSSAVGTLVMLTLSTTCGEPSVVDREQSEESMIVSAVASSIDEQAMWLVEQNTAAELVDQELDSVSAYCFDEESDLVRSDVDYSEITSPPVGSHSVTPSSAQNDEIARRVREVPGLVQAERMVNLYPATPGIVRTIIVSEGDRVEKGELLLSLEDDASLAAVEVARAQAESQGSIDYAESEVAFAQALVRRMDSARAGDARGVSQQEIDSARANLAKSIANLEIAKESQRQAVARLELEKARLASLRVVAPFAGTVTSVDITAGDKAFDNVPLLRLVDPSSLTVVLYIPWEHRDRLQPGIKMPLLAEGPIDGEVFGELLYVDPVLDPALQAVRTRWRIDNADLTLPLGFLVRFDPQSLAVSEGESTTSASAARRIEP